MGREEQARDEGTKIEQFESRSSLCSAPFGHAVIDVRCSLQIDSIGATRLGSRKALEITAERILIGKNGLGQKGTPKSQHELVSPSRVVS